MATIRTLSRDQGAMVQLRKGWRKISPSQSASVTGHTDMVKLLQREIGATRLAAVLAPKGDQEIPEVEVPQTQSPVIYIRLDGMTLLVAPPAHLPMQYIGYRDAAAAAGILRTMPVGHPAAAQIDLQAGRLPPGAKAAATGVALRQHLAWMLERRVLDAVILRDAGQIGAVMLQSDAPRAVSQMSDKEKILIAMERCLPLLKSDARALVGELIKTENNQKFIAMLVLFKDLRLAPGAGMLLDAWIIAELIIALGGDGARAATGIGRAATAALNAGTEADLDAAAILFKVGFEGFGMTGLGWLLARMQIKMTTAKAGPQGAKAASAAGAKTATPPSKPGAQPPSKSPGAPQQAAKAVPAKPIGRMVNPDAFFAEVKKVTGTLKPSQIDTINKLLVAAEHWPPSWLAYGLATAFHETGGKLAPNTESLNYSPEGLVATFGRHRISEADAKRLGRKPGEGPLPMERQWQIGNILYGGDWGKTNLGNTEPDDGWNFRGRGMDHCTGRQNYLKTGEAIGVDLIANPDALLDPGNAVAALVTGMETGRYTGRSLAMLPGNRPATKQEFANARPIINAMDKSDVIADYAVAFQDAAKAGGWK